MLSASAAITRGTLSNPLFSDDNDGRQIATRVELRPVVGLILGTSFARGPFVSQSAAEAAGTAVQGSDLTQTAWGGDAEYSRDHYVLRLETIVSHWVLPNEPTRAPLTALQVPLSSASISAEGRYRLRPAFYVAARYDYLGFSNQTDVLGTFPWDAPVTRVEVGGGYSIQRNLLLKGSFQYDRREGGRLQSRAHLAAAQLVFWF
jgi:hypothetical protein